MNHWIDSHTHIHILEKNETLWHNILLDAKKNQLLAIMNISTDLSSYLSGKQLSQLMPNFVFHTAGLYPSHADSYSPELRKNLISQLKEGTAVAIGECGIDYHWNYGRPDQQKLLFREQIHLAKDYNLPLIVHARDSYDDVYSILKDEKPDDGVVMHCWSGTPDHVKRFLDLGLYISFAGNVSYKKATDLQDSAKIVPLAQLLLETDAPYLTPMPHRGQTNNPAFIVHTARFITQLKDISLEALSQSTCQNAIKLFRLPISHLKGKNK